MKIRFFLSPFDAPFFEGRIREPTPMMDLFKLPPGCEDEDLEPVEVMEWFSDGGAVQLNGHLIPPDRWRRMTIKPHKAAELNFIYVPQGKKAFTLLASVALIALTTAISGGLAAPLLGAGFAAGTFGATALAAGVSLAGALAISALTAPPKVSNQGESRELAQAGVAGNSLSLLDVLPVIIGKVGASPPYLAQPYTEWDGDSVTAYAVVGVQGRCLVGNVKVNGLDISTFANAVYETREGHAGESARTLFTETVIEERDGIALSNFVTELDSAKNDLLVDQTTPDNSAPQWHYFRSAGHWTKMVLRFLFPSGIVATTDGTAGVVPVRIEIRKVGDASWRKLPTFHFADYRKGLGAMRAEIRLERRNPVSGIHYSTALDEYPVANVMNVTNIGDTPYESDAYFQEDTLGSLVGLRSLQLGLFTSATKDGYTISTSTANGTNLGWKAHDENAIGGSTYWQPTDGTLGSGCYWQIDCPAPTTFRSYCLAHGGAIANESPTRWAVLGSNDNWATSTMLDPDFIDVTDDNIGVGDYQIENPGAYTSYRWVFYAVKSGNRLRVSRLAPSTSDAAGCIFNDPFGSLRGYSAYHSVSYQKCGCKYVALDKKGARVFLKPDDWTEGEYEVRVMRGVGISEGSFEPYDGSGANTTPYEYNGNSGNSSHYFEYFLSGSYKVAIGQKNFRSDATIEAFQTIDADEAPFTGTDIALVAVAIPNVQITSIYAEFTRYASEWDGAIWSATEVPTQNPAALYRQILLGGANARPVPGDAIDEDGLADWFETCEAYGYEANAILQGARVAEAKQLIATAGYASPRDADTYGVVEDKDTSSEPLRFLITPQISSDLQISQELPELPDAIRAEYSDEDQAYAVDHVTVYRDGVTAETAKVFETVSYPGLTNATKVQDRARFDLRQAYLRQTRYSVLMGDAAITLQRGSLVGLSSDLVDGATAAGYVTEIEVSGGNVQSLTLDNIMPWGASGDVESIEDISAITDIVDPSQPMGVAIWIPGADVVRKQVSNITDSNLVAFTTPFPYAGSGLDTVDLEKEGVLVVAGTWTTVVRRCKVMSVVPQPDMKRLIVLADEAEGLFA